MGAMEEDDEDIYTVDSMSNYDMTMGGDDDGKFGWTGPSGKRTSKIKSHEYAVIGIQFIIFVHGSRFKLHSHKMRVKIENCE